MSKELKEINEKIAKIEKEQLSPLRKKMHELRDKENAKEYLGLVGKTFVFRNNSCGGGESPEDYWDVYIKVIGVFEYGVIVLSVEKTDQGSIEIKQEQSWDAGFTGFYEECPESEFEKEYKKLMDELPQTA